MVNHKIVIDNNYKYLSQTFGFSINSGIISEKRNNSHVSKEKSFSIINRGIILKLPIDIMRIIIEYLDVYHYLKILLTNSYFLTKVFDKMLYYKIYKRFLSSEIKYGENIAINKYLFGAYVYINNDMVKNFDRFYKLAKLGFEIAAEKYYRRTSLSLHFECEHRYRRKFLWSIIRDSPGHVIDYFISKNIISLKNKNIFGCSITYKVENTQLMILSGSLDCAKILLSRGTDPNIYIMGNSWLNYACKNKLYKIVYLLSKQSTLDIEILRNCLYYAITKKRFLLIKNLLNENTTHKEVILNEIYEYLIENSGSRELSRNKKSKIKNYIISLVNN